MCGTLSKALEKSRSMPSICRLLSNALWMSAVTMSSWVSHERFFAESMLGIIENGVAIKVAHYVGLHNVFHQFAADGREGYRAVV